MLRLAGCDSGGERAGTERLTSSGIVRIVVRRWELSINEELVERNKRLPCYWNDMTISTFWVEYVWVASPYNVTNPNSYPFSVPLFLRPTAPVPPIYGLLAPSHPASNKGCRWGNSTPHLDHSLHRRRRRFTLIHVRRSFGQRLDIIIEHDVCEQ